MAMNHASAAERASNVLHDRAYWDKHPERRLAGRAVERALNKDAIRKYPCWNCGATKVEAHHTNYDSSARLDVIWLCNHCHRAAHAVARVNGGAARESTSSARRVAERPAPPPTIAERRAQRVEWHRSKGTHEKAATR